MIAVVMLPGGGRQRAAPSTRAAAGESRREPVVSPFAVAGATGACAARQAAPPRQRRSPPVRQRSAFDDIRRGAAGADPGATPLSNGNENAAPEPAPAGPARRPSITSPAAFAAHLGPRAVRGGGGRQRLDGPALHGRLGLGGAGPGAAGGRRAGGRASADRRRGPRLLAACGTAGAIPPLHRGRVGRRGGGGGRPAEPRRRRHRACGRRCDAPCMWRGGRGRRHRGGIAGPRRGRRGDGAGSCPDAGSETVRRLTRAVDCGRLATDLRRSLAERGREVP